MKSSRLYVLVLSLFLGGCSLIADKGAAVEEGEVVVNTDPMEPGGLLPADDSATVLINLDESEETNSAEAQVIVKQTITLKRAENSYKNAQYNNALKEFQTLYAADEKNVYLLFKIGNTYTRLGNHDAAINTYKQVLDLDSKHSKAWYNLGVIYMKESAATWQEMRKNIKKQDPLYKAAKHYGEGMLDLIHQKNI